MFLTRSFYGLRRINRFQPQRLLHHWDSLYFKDSKEGNVGTVVTEDEAKLKYCLDEIDLKPLEQWSKPHPSLGPSEPWKLYKYSEVVLRSFEKYGSQEALEEEQRKRRVEKLKQTEQMVLARTRRAHEKRSKSMELGNIIPSLQERFTFFYQQPTSRIVLIAVSWSSILTTVKFSAALVTGSAALLAESFRSLVDMCNQLIYFLGVVQSSKAPNAEHPYGYVSSSYVTALAASGSLFFGGFVIGTYTGLQALLFPENQMAIESYSLAAAVLAVSLVGESVTIYNAIKEMGVASKKYGLTYYQYIVNGPNASVSSILAEDLIAVLGNSVAALALFLTWKSGNIAFDGAGAIGCGVLSGTAAWVNMKRNFRYLNGHAMPKQYIERCVSILKSSPIVLNVYDVKAVAIGAETYRFKAEILVNSDYITYKYLSTINQKVEREKIAAEDGKIELLCANFGHRFVKEIGDQIDTIEMKIREEMPEVKYVDIEII